MKTIAPLAIGLASLAAASTASAEVVVLDFDDLQGGEVVTTQYEADYGVRIRGRRTLPSGTLRNVDRAMVFDTRQLTGQDDDLVGPFTGEDGTGSYAAGNILIVSEDGVNADPDDSWSGGRLVLTFERAVTFLGFNAFDINGAETISLRLFGEDGELMPAVTNGMRTVGDNGYLAFDGLDVAGVTRAVFVLSGSGGIGDIAFDTAPVPVPGALVLFGTALAGAAAARRKR